jgi:hypothetical protein
MFWVKARPYALCKLVCRSSIGFGGHLHCAIIRPRALANPKTECRDVMFLWVTALRPCKLVGRSLLGVTCTVQSQVLHITARLAPTIGRVQQCMQNCVYLKAFPQIVERSNLQTLGLGVTCTVQSQPLPTCQTSEREFRARQQCALAQVGTISSLRMRSDVVQRTGFADMQNAGNAYKQQGCLAAPDLCLPGPDRV